MKSLIEPALSQLLIILNPTKPQSVQLGAVLAEQARNRGLTPMVCSQYPAPASFF